MTNWKLKIRKHQPIGLDLGSNSIKMIQLAKDQTGIRVVAAEKVRLDGLELNDEAKRQFIISEIKKILERGSFQGRKVITSLPSDKLKMTSLRLANISEEEINQILKRELEQRFGLNPNTDAIDYVMAGNVRCGDEIKNELILFAVDSETVRKHIELLKDAQLCPVAIDTAPCALFRNFERLLRRQEDIENTSVFVDLGSRLTTVIFGRQGQISFIKQIPIGGDRFDREIADRLEINLGQAKVLRNQLQMVNSAKIDDATMDSTNYEGLDLTTRQVVTDSVVKVAEELAEEMARCFRYYTVTFRGKKVGRAIFAGGEAYENTLLSVLRQQLTVEIKIAEPLKGFDISGGTGINFDTDRRGLLCEWALAAGLALKGLKINNETMALV